MPRKPTGKPTGRPRKPFNAYPGWIVKAIRGTIFGDLTDKQFPAASMQDAQSAVLRFNRARTTFVLDALEAGRTDEVDIVQDIVAKHDCDLDGNWFVSLHCRGLALDAVERVLAKKQNAEQRAMENFVSQQRAGPTWEEKLEQAIRGPRAAAPLSEEELAAHRKAMETMLARDAAATAKLKQQHHDADTTSEIDDALEQEPGEDRADSPATPKT
jgi:hypothetical protein